jgi:hypothetical protein
MKARLVTAAVLIACTIVVVAEDACVIAEPSGEVLRLPESRPTILHSLVVPTTSAVLTRFPSVFLVPVELSDPTVDFYYAAFIDYNTLTGEGLVGQSTVSRFEASNSGGGRTRLLTVAIPEPLELDRCHIIEVIVALRLGERDPKNIHTPLAPGGDIATWFYNPNGGLGGCPSLDAGIDAESDADSGESGVQ